MFRVKQRRPGDHPQVIGRLAGGAAGAAETERTGSQGSSPRDRGGWEGDGDGMGETADTEGNHPE